MYNSPPLPQNPLRTFSTSCTNTADLPHNKTTLTMTFSKLIKHEFPITMEEIQAVEIIGPL
jgi:hypothetical protein